MDTVEFCTGRDCSPEIATVTASADGGTWVLTVEDTDDGTGRVALVDADGTRIDEQTVDLAWTDHLYGAPLQCRQSGAADVVLDDR